MRELARPHIHKYTTHKTRTHIHHNSVRALVYACTCACERASALQLTYDQCKSCLYV